MILPDVNLLVYAHNTRAAHHLPARRWWDQCLRGPEGVVLAWAVLLGFVRITTHPRIFSNPLPVDAALDRIQEWLSLPHFRLVHPSPAHFQHWSSLLKKIGTGANLTTDAHLAALAIERGLILCTTDADFSRFPALKWRNPLIEQP